ncbi:prostaglandin E synthase 2-like protein [Dinothrombium tinctorium]|uniref:Prostaglandin E synthase 2-like protein n=1 Tax=Dinothrombium tinctorium TaxID=1965070 RepID=A0A443R6T7_9ACAR|nr:prostaglandin E synthase 2-like protein [Dinothrombium tinctorium]
MPLLSSLQIRVCFSRNFTQLTRRNNIRFETDASKRWVSERFIIRRKSVIPRLLLIGAASFTTVAAYEYYSIRREQSLLSRNIPIAGDENQWDSYTRELKIVKGLTSGELVPRSVLDKIPISRHIDGVTKLPDLRLILLQYQTCPFCCKVRAFLDYYGIPYDIVEVNPVLRSQIKFSKYRKVPIVLVDKKGEDYLLQLNDSSLIISMLATYLKYNKDEDLQTILKWYQNISYSRDSKDDVVKEIINRYFLMVGDTFPPEQFKQADKRLSEERKWREWGDDHFVHTLSPNIYRTFQESLNSFQYFSEVGHWKEYFNTLERLLVIYLGATVMLFVGKGLKQKHSLKDDVRESLYDSCRTWTKAIGKNRLFMGGDKPNLADLTIYGMLSSIEGCEAFQDALKHTNIGHWYYAVKKCCVNSVGHHDINVASN